MVKFKDDPALGKTVSKTTAWCFGHEPVKDMWALRFAAGGHKFSQLCAFKFESALPNAEYPTFSIAFVAKLRSKIYHLSRNSSQWYIFKKISPTRADVLTKEQLFANYGFDLDKFFDSDLFASMVSKFKALIKKGLSVEVPKFKKTLKSVVDQREVERFANSIAESYPMMEDKKVNDKYYSLYLNPDIKEAEDKDLDAKIEEEFEKKGIYADIKADVVEDEEEEKKLDEDDQKSEEQHDYEATCTEFAKQVIPVLMADKGLKALADADGNNENAIAWVICSLAQMLKEEAKDADLKSLGTKVAEACMKVML